MNVHYVERVSLDYVREIRDKQYTRVLRIKTAEGVVTVCLFSKNPIDLEFKLEG
jgi:hypothetical protein